MIYNTLGNDLQHSFKIMLAICSNFVQLFGQILTIINTRIYKIMKILNEVTLKHALEWQDDDEKVCYICDTFGIYAHMTNTIELIEAYMLHLLKFDENSREI